MIRANRAVWSFVALAGGIVLLVLGGGSAMGSTVLPAPEALPATMVAVVSGVPPRRGRVTKAEFQHALLLAAVSGGGRSAPEPGEAGYEKTKVAALQNLLEGVWIVGEAADEDISVTHRQVAREVASVKRANFKNSAEYHRFLRESHYTRRDVNERVEIQMLSTRLQRRISARIAGETNGRSEEQKAFQEFIDEFIEKWSDRTVCAPDYATSRCSNGPAA